MLRKTKPYTFMLAVWLMAWITARAVGAEKLQVVTTTTDLAAIARYVGGDKVEVLSLATGREDPHHIAAKPSYMMAVRKADLWIRTGMELEIGYESLVLDGSRNPRIRLGTPGHLDASINVLRLEVPTHKIDRSMGDIHPLGNPHYLTDPLNGRLVAKTIAKRMAQLVPEHASYFDEQCKKFERELDERMFGRELVAEIGGNKLWVYLLKGRLDEVLSKIGSRARQRHRERQRGGASKQGTSDSGPLALGGWLGTMRPHRGKKLIPYHRNWSYFVNRFGLVVPIELEPKPGIPPSPGRLTEVIECVRAEDVKVLMMATYFTRKAPDLVASQTGIKVVECAMFPGAQSEATDYFTLFDNLVTRVSMAFSG